MKNATLFRPLATIKVVTMSIAALFVQAACNVSIAAPVTYSFSTGANPSGLGLFSSSAFVSGMFDYDAMVPATGTVPGGATLYGIQNIAPAFPSSFANLAGSVAGFSFSDARGTTVVGNETFALTDFSNNPPTTTNVDFFQLNTQSQTPTVGFSLGGYTLRNVRMFWIEGQQVPELVPEFLSNQSLPGVLPGFQGRLALDFSSTDNPSGPQSFVFFDGLTVTPVPEPETYAMLLAGLGLLGFAAQRRKWKSVQV